MPEFVGRPIVIKPAFTWGNRPGFRAVAVTMAASPGGCGAVIFIFWSGNNPVKYTDPDGGELNDFKNTPAHRIANNWEYFYEKIKTNG
jgi:hypothetical protein